MKKIRRKNHCFLKFCAKCADVEKKSRFLCRMNNGGTQKNGCTRNGVTSLRVNFIYLLKNRVKSNKKGTEIIDKFAVFSLKKRKNK